MNLHRLDLVSLSLFALIVRSGSISKGADLARLAIGAASKRIADLESTIGAELFERHSRGITLTAAGEALKLHRHGENRGDGFRVAASDSRVTRRRNRDA